MNPIERMKQLVPLLNEAAKAYYQEDRTLMTDREYDALSDELAALEAATGVRLAGSPTEKVGYEVLSGLTKVPHETRQLSLDKTKEIPRLKAFLGSQAGLLSWKLDGLTLVLRYEGGVLLQAVTRGNGEIGEDVTHNARVFENIPLKIPFSGALTVRGEAVIGFKDFARINESVLEPDEKYKNPRNLCSGSVRQLNSEIAAKRPMRFFVFGLVSAIGDNVPAESKSGQLAWLAGLGFDIVEYKLVNAENIADTVADYQQRIPEQDVATDGLVLTFDDIPYSESLGATSKFPRDSLAFKWADELSETTLKYIEWNTSRTGLINPIAVFEPVEIEGTTVNKASLHNVSIVKQLALGEGDLITVYKANMIIPQVAENLTRSATAVIPAFCPVCKSETEVVALREGEALYCLNPNCQQQLIGALTHFCSRDAMNIEGLSEQTLEKFVERGFLNDYTDIFNLFTYEAEILQMEGFGSKSFQKLKAAVEKAKDVALPNFLYALGVKHVGLSNARLLCAFFDNDIEKIIQAALSDAYEDELLAIKGFGEVIAHSLHVYFANERNLALLRKVLSVLRFTKPEASESANHTLKGLAFVITGEVSRFENRKALQQFIENHGGRCTGSVTAKTNYLISNDAGSGSSKQQKARELNVPILNEDDFLKQFGDE